MDAGHVSENALYKLYSKHKHGDPHATGDKYLHSANSNYIFYKWLT